MDSPLGQHECLGPKSFYAATQYSVIHTALNVDEESYFIAANVVIVHFQCCSSRKTKHQTPKQDLIMTIFAAVVHHPL